MLLSDSVTYLCNELGIFRLTDINKYLIGRFMFRFCNNQVPALFQSFFLHTTMKSIPMMQDRLSIFTFLRQRQNFGKTGIRYRGAMIWNKILNKGIYPDTLECVFVKFLKTIVTAIWTLSNGYSLLFKYGTYKSFVKYKYSFDVGNLAIPYTALVCAIYLRNWLYSVTDMEPINLDCFFLPPLLYQC